MADVYRKGTKSVHVGWLRAPGVKVAQVDECNLDSGGEWGPAVPLGNRCEACFGPLAGVHERSRHSGRTKAATAGTAAALALAAAVFGSSLGEPVNILVPASGAVTSTPFATVTPGPSGIAPVPSLAPALTPSPTEDAANPASSPQPLPTFGPVPTYPPVPTFGPLPTWPPFPVLAPLPVPSVPKVCVHPGLHVGVLDLCKWPHQ